jgi:hypothetical protein
MDNAHDVEAITIAGTAMSLRVDGREYEIDLAEVSERLAEATPEQRAHYEVSPAGYGIHWPDVDEDLSIDGLIGVAHACPLAAAEV